MCLSSEDRRKAELIRFGEGFSIIKAGGGVRRGDDGTLGLGEESGSVGEDRRRMVVISLIYIIRLLQYRPLIRSLR